MDRDGEGSLFYSITPVTHESGYCDAHDSSGYVWKVKTYRPIRLSPNRIILSLLLVDSRDLSILTSQQGE